MEKYIAYFFRPKMNGIDGITAIICTSLWYKNWSWWEILFIFLLFEALSILGELHFHSTINGKKRD